jgi:hypothetical protein
VLDGDPALVFRLVAFDPHPMNYLRVLLGVQMCRYFYGDGPWDTLALAWTGTHRLEGAPPETRAIAQDSLPLLGAVVRAALDTPMRAFQGRALRAIVMPERVSPASLNELGARLGNALFTSAHWLWTEPLRIVGLTGLQLAVKPQESESILELQRQSMLRLGGALQTV